MAQLLGICIKNFKCLKDITLGKLSNTKDDALTNLTSIVGSNGSGKSSIFEIFSFISDCIKYGVDDACIVRVGLSHLISKDSSYLAQEEQFTKSTPSSLITEITPSTLISPTLTSSTLKATTSSSPTGASSFSFEFCFKGRDDRELITYSLSVGYSQIDPENVDHDEKETKTYDDAKETSAQPLLVSPSQDLSTTTGRSALVKSFSGRVFSAISSANLATSNLANSTSETLNFGRPISTSSRSVSTTSTASTRLSSNQSTDVKSNSTSALYSSSVSISSSVSSLSSTLGESSSCLSSTSNIRPCILQESLIKTVKDKASGSKDYLLMSFTKGKGVVFSDLYNEVNSDSHEIHKDKIVLLEDSNHLAISSVNELKLNSLISSIRDFFSNCYLMSNLLRNAHYYKQPQHSKFNQDQHQLKQNQLDQDQLNQDQFIYNQPNHDQLGCKKLNLTEDSPYNLNHDKSNSCHPEKSNLNNINQTDLNITEKSKLINTDLGDLSNITQSKLNCTEQFNLNNSLLVNNNSENSTCNESYSVCNEPDCKSYSSCKVTNSIYNDANLTCDEEQKTDLQESKTQQSQFYQQTQPQSSQQAYIQSQSQTQSCSHSQSQCQSRESTVNDCLERDLSSNEDRSPLNKNKNSSSVNLNKEVSSECLSSVHLSYEHSNKYASSSNLNKNESSAHLSSVDSSSSVQSNMKVKSSLNSSEMQTLNSKQSGAYSTSNNLVETSNNTSNNLVEMLQYLQREYPDDFCKILKRVSSKLPDIRRIETEINPDGEMVLRFIKEGFNEPFLLDELSSGTLKLLTYLFVLYDPKPYSLIFIEDPEDGLDPHLLANLVKELREYATSDKHQSLVFITTHSPYLVNALETDELWILEKGKDKLKGFSTISRASDNTLVKNLVNEGIHLGDLWYSGYLEK